MRLPTGHGHLLAALAVAAGLAAFAEAWRRDAADRAAHVEEGSGEVLAAHPVPGRPARRLATVRFEPAGRVVAVVGVLGALAVGERAPVWFDRRDPARTASLQPPAGPWRGPALLFALAALVAAAAASAAFRLASPQPCCAAGAPGRSTPCV